MYYFFYMQKIFVLKVKQDKNEKMITFPKSVLLSTIIQ